MKFVPDVAREMAQKDLRHLRSHLIKNYREEKLAVLNSALIVISPPTEDDISEVLKAASLLDKTGIATILSPKEFKNYCDALARVAFG